MDSLASDLALRIALITVPAMAMAGVGVRGARGRDRPRAGVHRVVMPPGPRLLGAERQERREQPQQDATAPIAQRQPGRLRRGAAASS